MSSSFADFSRRLRALRKSRQVGLRQLARALKCSPSWISKIEAGRLQPSRPYLQRILRVLRLPRRERASLLALWQIYELEHKGGITNGRDLELQQRAIGVLLSNAKVVRSFDGMVLSGPLQTKEYAKAIFQKGTPDLDWQQAWRTRLKWADLWCDPGREWRFVVHENALRFPVCSPKALRSQEIHLRRLAKRGRIHILRADTELPVIPPSDFTILDDTLVIVDTLRGTMTIQNRTEVAEYVQLFEALVSTYSQSRRSCSSLEKLSPPTRR